MINQKKCPFCNKLTMEEIRNSRIEDNNEDDNFICAQELKCTSCERTLRYLITKERINGTTTKNI